MVRQTVPTPAPTPAAEFPTIGILERRIKTGDSNIGRVAQITLQHQPEPMDVRVINTGLTGRYYQATQELGWVPVHPDEIEGGLSGDMRAVDGRVVMGEHGHEMLMKMPRRFRQQIQRAKEERQHRAMTSKRGFTAQVQRSMEHDARSSDRAGAEALERQAEALGGGIEVDQLRVSKERVAIGEA